MGPEYLTHESHHVGCLCIISNYLPCPNKPYSRNFLFPRCPVAFKVNEFYLTNAYVGFSFVRDSKSSNVR